MKTEKSIEQLQDSEYEGGAKKHKTHTSMSGSPKKALGKTVQDGFHQQKKRIQITSEWKDACINQEIQEVEKLEKFIQEERLRAHSVAENLLKKQQELEDRRKNLSEMKR